MKKQHKRHLTYNNQSAGSSSILPSDDGINYDQISDKEVDSFRENTIIVGDGSQRITNPRKKNNRVPSLDLSFQDLKDSNKNLINNEEGGASMISPILTNLREEANPVQQSLIKDPKIQYRKMDSDKTAPVSNAKSLQISPDRNPQSRTSNYQNSASNGGPVEAQPNNFAIVPQSTKNGKNVNINHQTQGNFPPLRAQTIENQKPVLKQKFSTTESQKKGDQKQQKTPTKIGTQPLDTNGQQPQRRHMRGPSQMSQGVELTLDEESYERDRYLRNGTLAKDGVPEGEAELFNDSQVSAIQNSGNLEFVEDGDEDDNLQEEDTSARRLLPGENMIVRSKNQAGIDERSKQSPPRLRATNNNTTIGLSRDVINFVDQSKEDYNTIQQFPVIKDSTPKNLNNIHDYQIRSQLLTANGPQRKNKIAPLDDLLKNTQENAKPNEDYFEFEPVNGTPSKQKNFKLSTFNKKASLHSSDIYGSYYQANPFTRKNTQDGNENGEALENSCLLDESQLKKTIYMPNVLSSKVELQNDIGVHLVSTEGNKLPVDILNNPNDDSFYRIIDKDSIEVIESYRDRCPCLNLRKTLMKIRVYINRGAIMIITNSIFESISITVIVANSLFLALDDPLSTTPPAYAAYSENIFQALYTIEMILKIAAMGFIFNKGAYLRDSWNLLDCIIVSSGYAGMLLEGGGANLSVLRSFRVIRPLRTISSIEGLRVIVSALVAALPLLRDTILVLIFFFMIFAIAGVQLFAGSLKNRCVMLETGVMDPTGLMCAADADCRPGYFCGKRNQNPNKDATSFDNILYAMLLIFQTVTLEGWTPNMIDLEMCVATWVVGYFIPIVFIGAFFLLNLTLAVIKSKFTEEHKNKKQNHGTKKKKVALKQRGIDETDEEENGQGGGGGNGHGKDLNEKMEEEINGIKNISPEKKRDIRDRYRIEELIKKMEIAIKQRETRDKVTPRTQAVFGHKRLMSKISSPSKLEINHNRTRTVDEYINNPDLLQEEEDPKAIMANIRLFNNINYGEFFKSNGSMKKVSSQDMVDAYGSLLQQNQKDQINLNKSIHQQRLNTLKIKADETIKEDANESHELTVLLNDQELVKKEGTKTDDEGNSKRYSSKQINKMLGIQGVPRFKNAVSPWLGQVFELEKYNTQMEMRASRIEAAQQNAGKIVMGGIAGIKNKKLEEETKKKNAYNILQDNFDIFEFLDGDEENYGDDEKSKESEQSSHSSGTSSEKDEDEARDSTPPDITESQQNRNPQSQYERKSTQATTEIHSFTKRNSQKDKQTTQREGELETKEDTITTNIVKPRPRPLNLDFKRRQTLLVSHKGIQNIEEHQVEEVKSPDKSKKDESPKKKIGIKEKVKNLFKKKFGKKPPPKPATPRLNKRDLNQSVRDLKRDMIQSQNSSRNSKSLPRQTQGAQQSFVTKDGSQTPRDVLNNTTMGGAQTTLGFGNRSTIRSKSEARKKEIQHKETQKFREKENYMNQRRNVYFAESVKHIGKSKKDIQAEKKMRLVKKRLINVGGGFEMPAPGTEEFKKTKLLRSGSLRIDNSKEDLQNKRVDQLNRQLSPQLKQKDTLRGKDFKEYYNKIKEEVKKLDCEELEIPNLQEVLYNKKKKIALKLKNYKFTSVHDIFQDRDEDQLEAANQHGKTNKPPPKKAKLTKEEKKKLQEQKKQSKRKAVNPFQKKILLGQKKYLHELIAEDGHDSDFNQDDVLNRLENNYNIDHRSNIHVTGTLSVVFDKPRNHTKIMNKNYFDNIHPEEFIPGYQRKFQESQAPATINIGTFYDGENDDKSKDGSIYVENNLSMGSMGQGQVQRSNEHSALYASRRMRNNSQVRSALNNSRSGSRSAGLRSRQGRRNNQSQAVTVNGSRQTVAISSNQGIRQRLQQRPEVMTDKQILKRLNHEVRKSRIYSTVNIKKLPEVINRKQTEANILITKKKPKKPKKKPGNNQQVNNNHNNDDSEEELSHTSNEEEVFGHDYFVDREIDMVEAVTKAKLDANNRAKDNIEWSGQDIMTHFDPYKARIALDKLNVIRVWPKGLYGYIKRWRTLLKNIMRHGVVENFMTLCVFANTIILSMDHYGIEPSTSSILGTFNTFFTITFSCEMFLKIFAVGLGKWLNDKMNYMDGTIVLMSLVEMVFMSGNGALSAFRSVRMFRTLRVLRVARLLRGLKSMMNIIAVIQRSISSFIYLGMLLFLFIFIYALLGMQLFGGLFDSGGSNKYNFDSFNQAFVTSFILLSMENWNQVMFNAMAADVNKAITVLYFISCIFIGNFMLLNLFLAILLDAFTAVEEEDRETLEKKEARDKARIESLKQKVGEDLVKTIDDVEGATLEGNPGDKNKKKKKKKGKKANTSKKQPESNILDESIEIDMETLAKTNEAKSLQKKKLFEGVDCERSIYIFTKRNPIRIICYKIISNNMFENIILVLIVLSSIKLISDTYFFNAKETDMAVIISGYLDQIFTILFTSECVMKCISFGFVQDNGSYLRETWSQMDFFIVVTSLIDASATNVNIPIIKILRLLRILRPLRFISHNSDMKTVVVALLSSMGGIFNVGIVVVAVFLMFSILGTNLFAGKLQYCTENKYMVRTKFECFKERGEWKTVPQNFDNVANGMITLFTVATLEGWPDLMYKYTDMTGVETGPKPADSPINAYFWVGFVFIGAFFFMNLFVGVLFMNFEAAQKDERESLLLDREEARWVDMMKMIVGTKPEIIKIPKNRISRTVYEYVKPETKFDFFIMICIILNMVQMAMTFEGQSEIFTKALEKSNYFFTGVFTIEAVLKLIANGSAYFIPTWHKFDFFVVSASFLDIAMGQLSANSLKFLRVGPQLARVLRVLRVSRLFRLLNKYKGLQALLQTITFSLPSLMNVFALLMLVYFIFSVLSVFMFNGIITGEILDPVFMNFNNFGQAMVINIRMSTGEDWPLIMYDTMNTDETCIPGINCGLSYSPVYFISFIMVCSYVMLNLFIMIIIQQFETYYLPEDNILEQFRNDLNNFKETWQTYAKEFEGLKIRQLSLTRFFKDLKGDLGMAKETDPAILRNCVKMNLEADEEGFIYFNELLFKTMKRLYGQERTKKKILADLELKTLEKLQKIKQAMTARSRKNERYKAVTVNPFLAVMYKNMSFKAWLKQYRMNLEKRQMQIQYQLERESSDEEDSDDEGEMGDYYYKTDDEMTVNEEEYEEYMREMGDTSQQKLVEEINKLNNSCSEEQQNALEQEILDTLEKQDPESNQTLVQHENDDIIVVKDQNPQSQLDLFAGDGTAILARVNDSQQSRFTIQLHKTQQLSQMNSSREREMNQISPPSIGGAQGLKNSVAGTDDDLSNMMNRVIHSVDGSNAVAVAQFDHNHDRYISVDNQEEYNSRTYLKKNL